MDDIGWEVILDLMIMKPTRLTLTRTSKRRTQTISTKMTWVSDNSGGDGDEQDDGDDSGGDDGDDGDDGEDEQEGGEAIKTSRI